LLNKNDASNRLASTDTLDKTILVTKQQLVELGILFTLNISPKKHSLKTPRQKAFTFSTFKRLDGLNQNANFIHWIDKIRRHFYN